MQQLYADDALIHGKEEKLFGGEGVVALAKKWLKAFPDAQITLLHLSKEEDLIVAHWKAEGVFTHPIMNMEPTEKKVTFHGVTNFRIENDKIIEHWAAVDYRPLMKVEELALV